MLRGPLSLLFWAFLCLSSLALFPAALLIWLATALFDRRLSLLHRFTCFWASLYTWLNPAWPVTIEGREKIDPRRRYVFVANHTSLLDILVLFRLFTHFKWVSKVENFRIPVIGWNMSLNRYIKLRRGDRKSTARMVRACEEALGAGSSVMFFPEGTRSADARLRAFRTGAFEIAKRTRTPVLPLILEGTAEALPKRGFVLRGRHPIRVRVLDEIAVEEFAELPVAELTARVHSLFARELSQAALGSAVARGSVSPTQGRRSRRLRRARR